MVGRVILAISIRRTAQHIVFPSALSTIPLSDFTIVTMPFTASQAISVAALISSVILVGSAIATIYLAGHADQILKKHFPAGVYGWNMSHCTEDGWYTVRLANNQSSKIKTFVSAALILFIDMVGFVRFWLPNKVCMVFAAHNMAAANVLLTASC